MHIGNLSWVLAKILQNINFFKVLHAWSFCSTLETTAAKSANQAKSYETAIAFIQVMHA